ncbi:hypothetical protein BD311DRAFT_811356 [Dichomitus squalens]|uniref:Uncharacterized protein n=1 Tax=Dichomitus squalens TaxID=114155 RepID=A0A4Q9M6N0_9APHY|nr:hypothetical protein BD311DRAFT_811356 [Dichomitus squalens]
MATLDSLEPRLYLLTETRTKHFGSAADVRSVNLFVNGVSAIFNVALPTTDIVLAITREQDVLQWIELAEGEALRTCEVSEDQRNIVLKILYAYRACYFRNGVTATETELFFRLVAEAAMALDDHEPADVVLQDLVDYIDGAFPSDSFPPTLQCPRPPVTCTSPPAVSSESLPSELSSSTASPGCPAPAPAATVAGMCVRPPRPRPKASRTSRPDSQVAQHPLVDGCTILQPPPVSLHERLPFDAGVTHNSPHTIPVLTSSLSPSAVAVERALGSQAPCNSVAVLEDEGGASDSSLPALESVDGSESDGEEPYIFCGGGRVSFEDVVNLDLQDFVSRLARQ